MVYDKARNSSRAYSLIYDGQLRSTHPATLDAVRFGKELQKADYRNKGEAKRFTVHHEQNGLQHEEDGYSKQED